MARTPLAARILIDPAFSDVYESNHSGELGGRSLVEADIQSPIDLPSRTPTHIRFAELGMSQLVEHQAADRVIRDSEPISSQMIAVRSMEEEIRHPKWRRSRFKDEFKWATRPRGIFEDSAPRSEFTVDR